MVPAAGCLTCKLYSNSVQSKTVQRLSVNLCSVAARCQARISSAAFQSTATNAAILGTSLHFPTSHRTARNRFLKAALTERIATWNPDKPQLNGIPTYKLINMYEKWGRGGFGMILTGNLILDEKHQEAAGNMTITKAGDCKERRLAYEKLVCAGKKDGALMIAQLSHAGRQTPITINQRPFAASEVQLKAIRRGAGYGIPIELNLEQIKTEAIDRFVFAARFCAEVGFDGIQLHAAHGYLISGFLSPTTNKRTDHYNGSINNRTRLVREVYRAVRDSVPDNFIVGMKMNSVEFQNEGLKTGDAAIACRLLDDDGIDFIELSGGNNEHLAFSHQRESTRKREAFFLEFTDEIMRQIGRCVVYTTGGFRTVEGMVKAIQSGSTHGIGIGRPATQEPDLPAKILSGKSIRAQKSLIDPDDYALSNFVSNSQMEQMGRQAYCGNACAGIMNSGDPETMKRYQVELEKFKALLKANGNCGRPTYGVLEFD